MGIKEKALQFAFHAHDGQFRRDEPDKPMIVHPLSVGVILEECGYDENVVSAGYLHDVIEDTKYTIEDINNVFGNDIANLVESATEQNRNASWEERKKETIVKIKTLPLRNKAVICADKISNLEDFIIYFTKTGVVDFHNFKRGYEEYKWYFYEIYQSLIYNGNSDDTLYQRLKKLYLKMFESAQNERYFRDIIFYERANDFLCLRKLCGQRDDISKLNAITRIKEPYVIDFTGTPYSGKKTIMQNLEEYYNDSNLKTLLVPSVKTNPDYLIKLKESNINPDILLAQINIGQVKKLQNTDYDIILMEKSLYQSVVLINKIYCNGELTNEEYQQWIFQLTDLIREYINLVVITYTDSLTSLRRRYYQRLAVPGKDFSISSNLDDYNEYLLNNQCYLDEYIFMETTIDETQEVSMQVANEINKRLRKRYIDNIKRLGN